MTAAALKSRDRRAMLIGALVLAPGLVFIWGVRPYQAALTATRDQLATERATLSRERGALATAQRNPELQRVTDSAFHAVQPALFEGRDDVIASAQVASYLGDVARRSHVWLQVANTRPATSDASGVRTLHVDLRAETDFQGLLDFLDALDRGAKLVTVERLEASRGFGTGGNLNAETLTITATVAGYALGDESGATAPVPPIATTKPGAAP
ncbi:MAG: GspMb/PilO family protein [Gemmatimonadaceae bacterium]